MGHTFAILVTCVLAQVEPIDTRCVQIAPPPTEANLWQRRPNLRRAVVLIHGLKLHPFSTTKVSQAYFHEWQFSEGPLVKALVRDADIFAYAYGQNLPLQEIHLRSTLPLHVQKLRFLGYNEIILIGHSAGGVLARMFVEDFPEAGVTKVVQVCSPNLGSSWAKAAFSVRKEQESFLDSLTREARLKICENRKGKTIPRHIQFVCVVGIAGAVGGVSGDGIVSGLSQWSDDLQKQGIPAVRIVTSHFTVLRLPKTAERVADLVREEHTRWTEEQVTARRLEILLLPKN